VTAPVSSLIIPKTYGVPVAFFGVPNDVLPAAAAAEVLPAAGVLEPLELLLEPLELHPAAASATTLRTATLSDLTRFIWASFGDGCICR
jgi:hypothetical protein